MYFYNDIELKKLIIKELKKDTSSIPSTLLVIHIESSIYKNDIDMKKDILKLLKKSPLFQKSTFTFISSGKIVAFSDLKKDEIEKAMKIFLSEAKKENIYKNISIGATVVKNHNMKLETLYQQVIRAIFHAETAGGWQYFFYSEDREKEFLESVKNFWEFNEELSDSEFFSKLMSHNAIRDLFERLDQFDNMTGLPTYNSFIKKAQKHIEDKNDKRKLAVF